MQSAIMILTAFLVTIALILVIGVIYQITGTWRDLRRFPPPGRILRSNNGQMHIRIAGEGKARLSVGEVRLAVAIGAKSDQIFSSIIAKRAARTNMVHLKAFRDSAILASPAISLQHIATKPTIRIRIESEPRLSLPN